MTRKTIPIFALAFALICVAALFASRRTRPVPTPPSRAIQKPAVTTGLENLVAQRFAPFQGKRIGLITNPTGVDSLLRTDIDLLFHAKGVKLAALYGPEHGVRGDAEAGASVGNARDTETGLPVYSLYGATRKPTAEMLRGVDILVFDIQDIGSRSYTYISTLGLCMEAAADAHLPLFVLDRPNPLTGERIEGNIPTPDYFSFVGRYPIPYAHGLTVGELARMMNGEGWLNGRHCDLTVIPMLGWQRDMGWNATGLPWVPQQPARSPFTDGAVLRGHRDCRQSAGSKRRNWLYASVRDGGRSGNRARKNGPRTEPAEHSRRRVPSRVVGSVLRGLQGQNVRRRPNLFHRFPSRPADPTEFRGHGRRPPFEARTEFFPGGPRPLVRSGLRNR